MNASMLQFRNRISKSVTLEYTLTEHTNEQAVSIAAHSDICSRVEINIFLLVIDKKNGFLF